MIFFSTWSLFRKSWQVGMYNNCKKSLEWCIIYSYIACTYPILIKCDTNIFLLHDNMYYFLQANNLIHAIAPSNIVYHSKYHFLISIFTADVTCRSNDNQPLQPWKMLCKPWTPKGFFLFEIIINFLVSSFRLIWIPMLWVLILLARGSSSLSSSSTSSSKSSLTSSSSTSSLS